MASHDVEMDDLTQRRQSETPVRTEQSRVASSSSDSTQEVWAIAVGAIFACLSLPLLFFPRLLLFLSNTAEWSHLTPLESFLSYQLGILVLGLACGVVMATPGIANLTSSNTNPLLMPIGLSAGLGALVAWNCSGVGSLGIFMAAGEGVISVWSIWTLLFPGPPNLSKKTGADKHTSTWLFGNKSAARAQKKEWKARQKDL